MHIVIVPGFLGYSTESHIVDLVERGRLAGIKVRLSKLMR